MKKQKRTILLLTILILVLTVLIVVLLLLKGKDKEGYEYQMSLGKQLMEQEKYDEALYCFEQAMEIEPKKEEPYMCMADIYEIQGRFDKMAEILQLGCDRAKEAGLAEQYERLAECLSEAREMAAEAGQLPESVTDDGVSDEAPAALTGEKLFEASQVINVLLDWKINGEDDYNDHGRFFYHHNSENLLEEAKNVGSRLDFLLRCFSDMESLYPAGIEDLAGNYSQMEGYFEEWGFTDPGDRAPFSFTDWTAALDLEWTVTANMYGGVRYSVPNAFYLEDFNRMLAEVFGGEVPALTVEELSDYTEFTEHFYWPFFVYDSTHGAVCRIISDGSTGGDWEPQSMYCNYIVNAEQTTDTITLRVQKLSIDMTAMYQDYSGRTIYSSEMTKEQYLAGGGDGKAYLGQSGQILAVDGLALTPLMPIHSYMIDSSSAYEDMECSEYERAVDGAQIYNMTKKEVFERLQANGAALLADPGAYGPYFTAGNVYTVVLVKERGYYRVVSVTLEGEQKEKLIQY